LGVGGLQAVSYVTAKLDLPGQLDSDALPADIEQRLLVTKFANWKYEKERRTFLELSSLVRDGDHYYLPFSDQLRLREVILGPLGPKASLPALKALAKAVDSKVLVSRARLGFKYFEVKPDGRYPPE
jgi:hypothetical protein